MLEGTEWLIAAELAEKASEAMTHLRVYDEAGGAPLADTRDPGAIAAALAPVGVRFEQWPSRPLAADAEQDEVLEAFAPEVERLKAEKGYRSVDVIRMVPDHPEKGALRAKFLSEHRHSEDEVRFFVEGEGLFTLRARRAHLCRAVRGGRLDLGARRHAPLVRHGAEPALHRDPPVHQCGRLDRQLHRRHDRRSLSAPRAGLNSWAAISAMAAG